MLALGLSVLVGFGVPVADVAQANSYAELATMATPAVVEPNSVEPTVLTSETAEFNKNAQSFSDNGVITPANGPAAGGEVVTVTIDAAPQFKQVVETELAVAALADSGFVVVWRKDAAKFEPKVVDPALFGGIEVAEIISADSAIYFVTVDDSVFVSDTAIDPSSLALNDDATANSVADILQIEAAREVVQSIDHSELDRVVGYEVLDSGSLLLKNSADDSTFAEFYFWPTEAFFGDMVASDFEALSANTAQAVTPAHGPGSTDVSVIYSLRVDQQGVEPLNAEQQDFNLTDDDVKITALLSDAYTFEETADTEVTPEIIVQNTPETSSESETSAGSDEQTEMGEEADDADNDRSDQLTDSTTKKPLNSSSEESIDPLLNRPQASSQNALTPFAAGLGCDYADTGTGAYADSLC